MAKKAKLPAHRSEDARALFHRAGNAHVPVAVDTRPKTVPDKTKFSKARDRKAVKAALKGDMT